MQDIKQRVALTSIAASAGLTLAKAAVGLATGSLAILSEAAHSLLDLAATVMTYFAVRISGKPADEEHHYGHGKVESVTALAETALLFLLSGIVIWEALARLYSGQGHAIEVTIWAFAVMAASIVIDFFRARTLYRVASETSSEALEADALHFGSDMWSSCAVLAGLAAVSLGYPWADSAAAAGRSGLHLRRRLAARPAHHRHPHGHGACRGRRQDRGRGRAPCGGRGDRSAACAAGGRQVVRRPGVAVSRTLPLERVAALKDRIVNVVRNDNRAAEVTVTAQPQALDDETVLDRIMVIARNRALAVHHVTVHTIEERLAVSLDLEVDGALSLAAAHDIASGLEQAIVEELGSGVEVETHIEPLQPHDEPGHETAPERTAQVHDALAEIAAEIELVGEIHDVRVRHSGDGEIVNFHCHVDPAITVSMAHERWTRSSARCGCAFHPSSA